MDKALVDFKNYFDAHREEIVEHYFTYLQFKTVSSEEGSKGEMEKCVDWLKAFLEEIDFSVSIWRSSSHPVVFAETQPIDPKKLTLLIYNHYDVQPVDPLELWESPPFEPTLRHGNVYARGAEDNKGQSLYVLAALKGYKEMFKEFPINIKLLIEGDEEVGSRGLDKILEERKKALKSDYLAIVDLGILSLDKPSIVFGVRGLVTLDLVLEGPSIDLHSGEQGGVVVNPIHALCYLLGSCHDAEGRVAIPGFYDGIKPLSPQERGRLALDFDEAEYIRTMGVAPKGGEKGYSPFERSWLRPTLEVNGITGGYTGKGFKTVIPSKASAKISCRLVDGQDPEKIALIVKEFFDKNTPEGTKATVHIHSGKGLPVRSKLDSPLTRAAIKAYEEVFGKECVFTLCGGSIPITSELAKSAEADIVFLGLGLSTDLIHAPNEHFDVDRIGLGFCIIGRMIQLLGEVKHV